MRALVILMLFLGMALVIHSVYAEKLERAQRNVRIEYSFLPGTLYEEQLAQSSYLLGDNGKLGNMFSVDTPWV